ncbi:MAG: hypothetical protein WBF33_37550 [Candidatus Nitrosopolaris sp.]
MCSKKYGVYPQQDGMAEGALFVIDSKGVIRWSYVSPIGVNPGAEREPFLHTFNISAIIVDASLVATPLR